MLIAILALHAPSPGSQTVRHTGTTLMKGGLGGGWAENLKIFFVSRRTRSLRPIQTQDFEGGVWKGKRR